MAEKTRMTPEWIARVWQDNPTVQLENGNIRTGPVRMAFCNMLERGKDKNGKEKSWGGVLLVPDFAIIGADALKPMKDAALALYGEKAPLALTNPDLMAKYHNPFKKQGEWIDKKTGQLYDGFVPGRTAISSNSPQSKPYVVDQNGAPIVDKSRIYSGCWVLASVSAGWIKAEENPGPTFYMQGVIVIADDDSLGGIGVANPQADMQGVKIDSTVNPSAAFGLGEPMSPAPAAGIDLFA